MKIVRFLQLESTNTKGLELAADGAEHGTVVSALKQTGGRGQYERSFFSPPGGLYLSVILRPELVFENLPAVTLAAGIACVHFLKMEYGMELLLKWPNDLYFEGKKLAGILTETLPLRRGSPPVVVVGIGINLKKNMDVPGEIAGRIVFLENIQPLKIKLPRLLEGIVEAVIEYVNMLVMDRKKLLALYEKYDHLLNKTIRWDSPDGSELVGIGQGIGDNGQYRLLDDAGTVHLISAGSLSEAITSETRNHNQ